ncbi:O-antigen ligase family protein [Micromonosporaceae bacterium Da 78-11]
MTASVETGRRRPGGVVIVAFVATLAGRFTLTRIGIDVPVINDIRVLLLSILLMSFVLEMKYAGHRSGTGSRALLAVLLLLGYQTLSAGWAPADAARAAAVGDLVATAVLVLVYATLAEWDRDRVVRVTLACFHLAAWVYFLSAASGRGHASNGRWAALGGGPNVFVRVMILGVLTALYFYVRSGRKAIWLCGIPAFLAGALASGSRGGIVALIITIVVAVAANISTIGQGRSGRNWAGIVRPLVTVAVVIAVTWVGVGDAIGGFVEERFLTSTVQQGYTSDRDVLFKAALELFLRRPFTGYGVNGFYAVTNFGAGERYVHNLPLAVAAEGGIIGLVLLFNAWFWLRHEFALVPRGLRSPESRTVAYCGIFIGATSLFSGDYYDTRLMWIFLLLAAVRSAEPDTDPARTQKAGP